MVTKTLDVGVSNTTIDLSATIKSFDVLDTKFIFGITSNQGLAINLSGATVKYIVEYYVEGKSYAIEGNCLVVDINTISFNLPDQLRGYNGKALIGIYATLTDGTKIDIKNIIVNVEPSLMDKGTDLKQQYYFGNMDVVIAKVQKAGNDAVNKINAVLPTVQNQVADLNRQIQALPKIPDLYVAYADDANGNGFSKTDNSKLFKGYSVRNSTSPSDYRWERNSSNLQIGGSNLFVDSGFKNTVSTGVDYAFGKWYSYSRGTFNYPKYDNTCNYLYFVTSGSSAVGIMQFFDTNKIIKGKTYSVRTWVKVDADTIFKYQLIKKNPDSTYNWYFRNTDVSVTTKSEWVEITWTFDIPIDDDGIAYGVALRILQTGTETALRVLKPKLEIGNVYTGFSFAHEDLMLNSNPINSILTTLSAENPSNTLGGTWTQLGTETKFEQTIYYWKRTN